LIKTAALYLRVSTSDKGQTTDNQRLVLEEVARRHGWEITHVFEDAGVSGTKGRDQRPAFNELMQGVVRKDFDIILTWAVDRLSRSLQDLIAFLTDIQQKKVHLYVHQSALDTSSAHGTMLFQLLGIFSQFEASMIRSRVMAGLDRAKAQGKRLGRPSLAPIEVKQIRQSLDKGLSIRKAAKKHGVSTATIMRVKQEAHTTMMAPPSPTSG
jgi:DNA invertase Pin-like site-specific DNA recombinase